MRLLLLVLIVFVMLMWFSVCMNCCVELIWLVVLSFGVWVSIVFSIVGFGCVSSSLVGCLW